MLKPIRYALASICYHKTLTFIITFFALLFTFLLTGLLNLAQLEKELLLFQQNTKGATAHHQAMLTLFQTFYWSLTVICVLFFLVVCSRSLVTKKKELAVWHYLGVPKKTIIRQLLLEMLGPLLLGMGTVLLFTLLFQRTYIGFIWQLRILMLHWAHISEVTTVYFNPETTSIGTVVSTIAPNLSVKTIHAFAIDLNSFNYSIVLKNWLLTTGLLLVLVSTLTLITTLYYVYHLEKKWRFLV